MPRPKLFEARVHLALSQDTFDVYKECAGLLNTSVPALLRDLADSSKPQIRKVMEMAREAQRDPDLIGPLFTKYVQGVQTTMDQLVSEAEDELAGQQARRRVKKAS